MNNKLIILVPIALIFPACSSPSNPVHESTSTPTPVSSTITTSTIEPSPTPSEPMNIYGISINMDKSDVLADGYMLYGNISWTDPLIPPYSAAAFLERVTDANGKVIPFNEGDMWMHPPQGELRVYWSYKLQETNFASPLTLSFVVEASRLVDKGSSFTFDPGPNPELGQKWEINQDVIIDDSETIHILSAEQGGIEKGFFVFTMQSDSNIVGATIEDLEHPSLGGGGGGGGVLVAGEPFSAAFQYQTPLPEGPYTLTFIRVGRLVPGEWTLVWSP